MEQILQKFKNNAFERLGLNYLYAEINLDPETRLINGTSISWTVAEYSQIQQRYASSENNKYLSEVQWTVRAQNDHHEKLYIWIMRLKYLKKKWLICKKRYGASCSIMLCIFDREFLDHNHSVFTEMVRQIRKALDMFVMLAVSMLR